MEKDGLFGLLTGDPAEIIVVWKLRNGCMILVASHVFLDRYHGGSSLKRATQMPPFHACQRGMSG